MAEKRFKKLCCRATCVIVIHVLDVSGDRLCGLVVSFWLEIQRSRVRFPALPDFLSGSVSGMGYTQPREVN